MSSCDAPVAGQLPPVCNALCLVRMRSFDPCANSWAPRNERAGGGSPTFPVTGEFPQQIGTSFCQQVIKSLQVSLLLTQSTTSRAQLTAWLSEKL